MSRGFFDFPNPVCAAVFAIALAATASAQTDMTAAESHGEQNADFSKAEIHVLPVQGNIYMLVGDGANITLQVGKQGALLVNTGFDKMSDKVVAVMKKMSERPLQYIINTNSYPDSTGGNEPVRLAGTTITGANVTNDIRDSRDGAQILAQRKCADENERAHRQEVADTDRRMADGHVPRQREDALLQWRADRDHSCSRTRSRTATASSFSASRT